MLDIKMLFIAKDYDFPCYWHEVMDCYMFDDLSGN